MYVKTNQTGISKRQLKDKSWVFYGSYWDSETKRSVRKKIGGKKDNVTSALEAKKIFYKMQDVKKDVVVSKEDIDITLNYLHEKYFDNRYKVVKENFILSFGDNLKVPLEEDNIYRAKKQAVTKEKNRFKNHISKHFIASKSLEHITLQDLIDFKSYVIDKENIGTKTKHLIYALAKTIWTYGIDHNYTKIANIFLNKEISKQLKNPQYVRERVLSVTEQSMLIWKLEESGNYNAYVCAKIGLITGARSASILGILKRDINIDKKILTINNYKTHKTYKIPFSSNYIPFFKNVLERIEKDNHHIIQSTKYGYKGTALAKIPKKYFQICDELFNEGLDKKDSFTRINKVVGFHTLRHTKATSLANSNVPLHIVQKFLNHSSIETTLKYLNTDTERMREQIDKDSLISSLDSDFEVNEIDSSSLQEELDREVHFSEEEKKEIMQEFSAEDVFDKKNENSEYQIPF